MNELDCTVCQTLMHGYLDKELDPPTTATVAGHLAECAECARLHDQARLLMLGVKRQAPYYTAPASLTASVFAAAAPRPNIVEALANMVRTGLFCGSVGPGGGALCGYAGQRAAVDGRSCLQSCPLVDG